MKLIVHTGVHTRLARIISIAAGSSNGVTSVTLHLVGYILERN